MIQSLFSCIRRSYQEFVPCYSMVGKVTGVARRSKRQAARVERIEGIRVLSRISDLKTRGLKSSAEKRERDRSFFSVCE